MKKSSKEHALFVRIPKIDIPLMLFFSPQITIKLKRNYRVSNYLGRERDNALVPLS